MIMTMYPDEIITEENRNRTYYQPWWQRAILWLAIKYFGEKDINYYTIITEKEWFEQGFWRC